MWLSDFRKFAEQFGEIIGWDATNNMLGHSSHGSSRFKLVFVYQEKLMIIKIN